MSWSGNHLNDNTDRVDHTARNDSPLATDNLGDIPSDKGTEKGTCRQDRYDERFVARFQRSRIGTFSNVTELFGGIHTINVTGVVAELDTTKRCESADNVSLPGHGSLIRLTSSVTCR